MTFALWTIGTIVAALALYILLGIYRLLTPTRGERIDRSSRAGEALVVIDLQSDFTRKTGTKGYDPARVETTLSMVNALAKRAHEEGVPVVAIRQVVTAPLAAFIGRFLAGPEGFIGSPGIGLDPRLDIKADRDFTKDRGDAFSSLAFEAWLGERKIGKLRIVGLDGCYCVRLTSMGALSRGYAVELIERGVLVSDARRWTECKTELSRRGASFAAA